MIKHEEAKSFLCLLPAKLKDFYSDYITEQEKKDELLGLYRELHETQDMVTYENILDQIKELEEEMK